MAENTTPPAAADGGKLTDILRDQFSWIVKIFGSVAAVTAFLLFAGFLSDFGAFRLAGLPRLNMNLTATIEQGADTMIDAFALLGGGVRAPVLVLLLGAVVLFWGWCESPRLRAFTRSVPLYRLARVLLLVLAALVSATLIERIQRSLSGAHHGPASIESALRSAYDRHGFPDPYQRALALERLTYELSPAFPLPNWGARLETLRFEDPDTTPPGIAIRQLAEGRAASRHVFGWVALSVLVVLASLPLLAKWGRFLNQEEAPTEPAPGPSFPPVHGADAVAKSAAAHRRGWAGLLRALRRTSGLLGQQADQPLALLLAPLTLALGVLALGLLPLAHGLLARESLGSETVMVYLEPGALEDKVTDVFKPEAVSSATSGATSPRRTSAPGATVNLVRSRDRIERQFQDVPEALTRPDARMECAGDWKVDLREPLQNFREAQRDLINRRPNELEFKDRTQDYVESLNALASQIVETSCAEAITVLLEARPPVGLRALQPGIAEIYQRVFHRLQAQFQVRVGSILGSPREDQGLILADSVVPLPLERGGRITVVEIPRAAILRAEVIPDLQSRTARAAKRALTIDPDSTEAAQDLLTVASGQSLSIAMDLLTGGKLHANRAAVSLTAMGTMAQVAAFEAPAAARDAVALLGRTVDRKEAFAFWPDRGDAQRSAAVSSLHLARMPFAAHTLIDALGRDAEAAPCGGSADSTAMKPLACLATVPTAAGFAFQDLLTELQHFRSRPPTKLIEDRDKLVQIMIDVVVRNDVRDDVRGAACTALTLGGRFEIQPADGTRFFEHMVSQREGSFPISTPSCIAATSVLGLDRGQIREWLRSVARTPEAAADVEEWHMARRRAALIALTDLGLEPESRLMLDLHVRFGSQDSRIGELVRRSLDEVDGNAMGSRFRACALDTGRGLIDRALCLDGLRLTDDDFDGDDGTAEALFSALASGAFVDLEARVCGAMKTFLDRDSLWMLRKLRDEPRAFARHGCDLT